jgi:uncharacterized BrkB/YihY/UPF0761 family membrane protein
MSMQPVKVPQHLELDDVLVWGLGAVDLLVLAAGVAAAWWLYLAIPPDLSLRLSAALPAALAGVLLGVGHLGDRSLREWLVTWIAYLTRPRRRSYGATQ